MGEERCLATCEMRENMKDGQKDGRTDEGAGKCASSYVCDPCWMVVRLGMGMELADDV